MEMMCFTTQEMMPNLLGHVIAAKSEQYLLFQFSCIKAVTNIFFINSYCLIMCILNSESEVKVKFIIILLMQFLWRVHGNNNFFIQRKQSGCLDYFTYLNYIKATKWLLQN